MTKAKKTADAGAAELLASVVAALGGERREGQVSMAKAVESALSLGEHLLVQAGTGTGKSLAYLVPAVARAVQANERIVVSTATLALQRQVFSKDLPAVIDALQPAALPLHPQPTPAPQPLSPAW